MEHLRKSANQLVLHHHADVRIEKLESHLLRHLVFRYLQFDWSNLIRARISQVALLQRKVQIVKTCASGSGKEKWKGYN